MTVSELYSHRTIVESFGKSRAFEICRRFREQWPGFPSYMDQVNEFIAAWIVLVLAKAKTNTKRDFSNAVLSGKSLRSGDESFVIWLSNVITKPEWIKENLTSIWVYMDSEMIQVNLGREVLIFQGKEKVKSVARATHLSGQFLYDFSKALCAELKDESIENQKIFES